MVHLRACLERQGDLRVKFCSPLGGDTGTSRVTQERPRSLGMENPEAAAEVEVEAGLGEVLSRQHKR